jgi:hydrogenase nickel incorporation protein HypB
MNVITVERKILEKNDEVAARNRAAFAATKTFVINMVSSPGSGKTSVIERTLERLRTRIPIAVVEGDVQTDLDAQRVAAFGVPVVQIVTHGACHLEAPLLRDAVRQLDLAPIRLLIVENVGNLVCPASYDLGEAVRVVVVSTTEGDDKPLKYPKMFRTSHVLLINKIDLLPHVPCRVDVLRDNALRINPQLKTFELSCTTREGLDKWISWIDSNVRP